MSKTIELDGVIGTGKGEISSKWFASQLPDDGSEIVVKVHSEGGSVVEGFRIFDLAKNYAGPKRCVIESAAYSIASFIPMAFDEVEISPNGYMMLHNPYMGVEGDDEELAAKSEFLRKLKTNMVEAYAAKSGLGLDEVASILKAESYLNAREVVAAGFADNMTSDPVIGRVFAKLDSMPHGVVSALFGSGSGGDTEPPKKETPMSDSKPVAATVREIKSAFPALAKAKPGFVVECLEKEMPLASVATAAAEEMMTENEELAAKVAALEDELAKAKAEDDEAAEAKAKAEGDDDDDDEADTPAAKRKGVKPVAKANSSGPSARVKWDEAVEKAFDRTKHRGKAVALANRNNPGLRQAMLDEVNA